MVEVKRYRCEYCKTLYDTEDEAKKCEDSHKALDDTVTYEPEYKPIAYRPDGLPDLIYVTFTVKDDSSSETENTTNTGSTGDGTSSSSGDSSTSGDDTTTATTEEKTKEIRVCYTRANIL